MEEIGPAEKEGREGKEREKKKLKCTFAPFGALQGPLHGSEAPKHGARRGAKRAFFLHKSSPSVRVVRPWAMAGAGPILAVFFVFSSFFAGLAESLSPVRRGGSPEETRRKKEEKTTAA